MDSYGTGFMILKLTLAQTFPTVIDFYHQRLFSLTTSNGGDVYDLTDEEVSEGYRIHMFKKILNFVSTNPLTGSGYLGVWVNNKDLSGSSHNQYTDVLFRTGIFGFSAYIL
jgi:O-antigen ligase